jgi:tRNA(Ile)-lysidine synthase
MALFEEFRTFARENKLFSENDRILLAVSGGIDSMVMLHLFTRMGSGIVVAHCNFKLRENESDLDEELVGNYAASTNIPFIPVSFDTSGYAAEQGISIQMAARELRYDWFEKIKAEKKCSLIAVAHNLNDNIETLLINLIRGTGLTGLTGMKPSSGGIIRPLLFATRAAIEEYRSEFGVPYREDRSNAENKYTRNKIRHLVIPVLREIISSVEKHSTNGLYGLPASKHTYPLIFVTSDRSYHRKEAGHLSLIVKNWLNTAAAGQCFSNFSTLLESLNRLQVTFRKLIRAGTGKQLFTPSHRILRNRDEIIVSPLGRNRQDPMLIESVADLLNLPLIRSVSVNTVDENFRISRNPRIACIDRDLISLPLTVRRWKEGDWFHPLGMAGRKKLSDYFVDRKYSLLQKEETMILESAGKIVWVMGDRLDDRFRVTESTTTVLLIELSDPENEKS